MTSPKKPGVAFWATVVVVVVLVAYPLSFGPACWITSRTGLALGTVAIIYRPFIWAMSGPLYPEHRRMMAGLHGGLVYIYPPEGWIEGYARLGAPAGWRWRCRADFGFRNGRIEQLSEDVWEWADATGVATWFDAVRNAVWR